MTHEQLRDALRDAHETMHKVLGVFPSNDTGCEDLSRAMKKCREALAALDREGAGVSLPADRVQIPENRKQAEAMVVVGQAWLDQNKVATPPAADMHYTHDSTRLFMSTAQRPAAESDVKHSADGNSVSYSGDGTARRKIPLPKNYRPGDQLVVREVQHPPAAEREGADAFELKAWREMFAAFAMAGLPENWPKPALWPNKWPQDVAMVAFALHREKELPQGKPRDAGRMDAVRICLDRGCEPCAKAILAAIDAAIDKQRQEPPK